MFQPHSQQSLYNKEEDDNIREVRKDKIKILKEQLELFAKIIDTNINFDSAPIHRLIFKGIPSRFRSTLWPEMMRNRHGITPEFYSMLQKKTQLHKAYYSNNKQIPNAKMNTMQLIKNDISRTFPQTKLFRDNTELALNLEEMLEAWVVYRPDIGYIQGMSQIAGFLLTELKDYEALGVFASLVTAPLLLGYYTFNNKEMQKFEMQFEKVFRTNNEQLWDYFKEKDVNTRMYLLDWIFTLFTRIFEFEVLGRIWDLILLHEANPKVIVEIAYSIIHVVEKTVKNKIPGEEIGKFLKNLKIGLLQEKQLFEYLQICSSM